MRMFYAQFACSLAIFRRILASAAFGRNQTVLLEGRAAVASASNGQTATTERGPLMHPQTCAQNAHVPP